jgi:hypothetical protein
VINASVRAQSFDRVEPRRFPRRINAGNQTDAGGNDQAIVTQTSGSAVGIENATATSLAIK